MKKLALAIVPVLFTIGCMDERIALTPGAEKIRISTSIPQGCEILGDVMGRASVEGEQSEAMADARNDIRNKASALGATDVELQTNNAQEKMGVMKPRIEVTITGVAHRCSK